MLAIYQGMKLASDTITNAPMYDKGTADQDSKVGIFKGNIWEKKMAATVTAVGDHFSKVRSQILIKNLK